MPFTFSHPIFAAPLKKVRPSYLSLTGLILGSMAPDFEYFIALEPYQKVGHTWQGLLLQAFPLCLIFACLFHIVIKRTMILHIPHFDNYNSKLYRMVEDHKWSLRSPMQLFIFFLSVSIGFCTHILIDACTHQLGFVVRQFTFLKHTAGGVPIYKWLQYSLSLFGLAAELIILFIFLKRQSTTLSKKELSFLQAVSARKKCFYWFFVLVVMVVLTLLKLLLTASSNLLGILIVTPISGFMLGILVASILFYVREELH